MIDAQKPGQLSLSNVVYNLRNGNYVIPDFQRGFEWKSRDILALMSSIFQGYYIGNLLLWKGQKKTFEALSCDPVYGFKGTDAPNHIVLDGQQRLTAMYYAFMAPDKPAPGHKSRHLYFIKVDSFMDEAYEDAFTNIWGNKKLKKFLNDPKKQYRSHTFPLAMVGKVGFGIVNWLQDYEKFWQVAADNPDDTDFEDARRHAANAKKFKEYIEKIMIRYQISYIELDQDLETGKVCDIFTQINSRGVRLSIFDLINALVVPKGIRLRQKLWKEAKPRLDFFQTEKMKVYVLQVMSILRQTYCSPKYLYYLLPGSTKRIKGTGGKFSEEVLMPDSEIFEKRWHDAVAALEKAISILQHPQELGAISKKYLPYASILPSLASLLVEAKRLPAEQQLAARHKIHIWYWASVLTQQYSRAVESRSTKDYKDVRRWFGDDGHEPTVVSDFTNGFKEINLGDELKRGSAIYNGMFNLLVLKGARDWITGDSPSGDGDSPSGDDLDDHHIVPKSWGNKNRTQTPIDSILNRTPLSSETNRKVIRDRLPNEYLPELVASSGENEVRGILATHCISERAFDILLRDSFTVADFEDFVEERRRTLIEGIESLLIKERL